jgi:hypothetical protein
LEILFGEVNWPEKRQPERAERFAQFYAKGIDDLVCHLD